MPFTVNKKDGKKVSVEFDALSFERVAAAFGFMSDECKKSVKRAENDIRAGRVRAVAKGTSLTRK